MPLLIRIPQFVISVILLSLFSSCDLDQVEEKYENYKIAQSKNLFDKEWIPEELVFESMTKIYLRTNLDLNTYFFSYKLSESDFDKLKLRLRNMKSKKPYPQRVDIPKKFKSAIEDLDTNFYWEKDRINIKLDEEKNTVYGWH